MYRFLSPSIVLMPQDLEGVSKTQTSKTQTSDHRPRKRRPRKHRPCAKQRPRKHRRVTNTLKITAIARERIMAAMNLNPLVRLFFFSCYLPFCFQFFQIGFQYPKVDNERCYRA